MSAMHFVQVCNFLLRRVDARPNHAINSIIVKIESGNAITSDCQAVHFNTTHIVASLSDDRNVADWAILLGETVMAILQNLETSYLAILRFVVIVASGLLLVATLLLSASALIGMRDGDASEKAIPEVVPDQIISALTETQSAPAGGSSPIPDNSNLPAADPSDAHYASAADAIVAFVEKYGRGVDTPKENVISALRTFAQRQATPELVKSTAAGLPLVFEKVLGDKTVIELVSRQVWSESNTAISPHDTTVGRSPLWVIGRVLQQYSRQFNQQVKQAAAEEENKRMEQAIRKEQALMNLYFSAAAFGVFIMLALLSIIIRVERNLRPLAHLSDKTAGCAPI